MWGGVEKKHDIILSYKKHYVTFVRAVSCGGKK